MPRIFISRTPGEWKIIEERLKQLSRSKLGSFINTRLSLIMDEYNDAPWVICDKVQKRVERTFYIQDKYYKIVNGIAIISEVPNSTVVDRLIIEPLIHP